MAAKGVFEHVQRKPVDFKHEVKSQRDSVGIVQMFKRVFDLFEFPLLQLLTAVFFAHDRGWRKLWAGGFEGTVIQDVLLSRQSTRKCGVFGGGFCGKIDVELIRVVGYVAYDRKRELCGVAVGGEH